MLIESSLLKNKSCLQIHLGQSFKEPMPGKGNYIFRDLMYHVHMLLQIFFDVPVVSDKGFQSLINFTYWTLVGPSNWHFVDGMKF